MIIYGSLFLALAAVAAAQDVAISCVFPCYAAYSVDITACGVPEATPNYDECNRFAFGNKTECLSACGEDRPTFRHAGAALARVFQEANNSSLVESHDNFTHVLNETGDKLLSIDRLYAKFLRQAEKRLERVQLRLEAALNLVGENAPEEVTVKLMSDITKVTAGIDLLNQLTTKPCYTSIVYEIESNEDTVEDLLVDVLGVSENIGFPRSYSSQYRRAWNKIKQARRFAAQSVAMYQRAVTMGRRKSNQAIREFDELAEDLVISESIRAAVEAELIEYRTMIVNGAAISQCIQDAIVP